MTEKKRWGNWIFGFVFCFFIFQGILEDLFPTLRFYDEFVAFTVIPFFIYFCCTKTGWEIKKWFHNKWKLVVLLVMFAVSGMLGNILWKFQPWTVVLPSMILSIKFFMIMIAANLFQRIYDFDLKKQEKIVIYVSLVWALTVVILFVAAPAKIELSPWDICSKAMILFVLLFYMEHYSVWLNRISMFLMLILLLMTGKEKAYGGLLCFIVLYYLIVKRNIKTKIVYFFYIAVPILLLAWDKIYYYFVEGNKRFAKSIMMQTSLEIATDYFPFGTGFGTFGSTYTTQYYSPVYYLYGIAENKELGVHARQYLTDMFWPMLLGENGVIGTIIYVLLLFYLFYQIQRIFYYDKLKYFLLIFLYVFMLMTTFSEAGFVQPVVMVYAWILGIMLGEYEKKKSEKLQFINREA